VPHRDQAVDLLLPCPTWRFHHRWMVIAGWLQMRSIQMTTARHDTSHREAGHDGCLLLGVSRYALYGCATWEGRGNGDRESSERVSLG
jgi:hypothetical protein